MAATPSRFSVVKIDTHLGAPTDISTHCNECTWPRELDKSEVIRFGQGSKEFLPGLAGSTVSLSGPWARELDNLMSALYDAFKNGDLDAGITLEYGMEGEDPGDVRYRAEVIMDSYEPGSSGPDPVEWSAEFTVTGDGVTVDTY